MGGLLHYPWGVIKMILSQKLGCAQIPLGFAFYFWSCFATISLISWQANSCLWNITIHPRYTPWNERWIGEKIALIVQTGLDHVTFYEGKVKTLEFRTNLRKQCNFFRHKTVGYDWIRCEATQSNKLNEKVPGQLCDWRRELNAKENF